MTVESLHSPRLGNPVLEEGQTVGDFRIVRKIGAGAMADVFLANQISLGRPLALKVLRPEHAGQGTYLRRFLLEARAAARLEHPNIVHIYEVGTLPAPGQESFFFFKRSRFLPIFRSQTADDDSLHFIAEEYVPGMNLGLYVKRHGPLGFRQVMGILRQVASALDCAASFGIVHRDIKPENILLCESGRVKVADFGLAFCPTTVQGDGIDATTLTQIGITLGTPLYMSPEQARGAAVDSRSDLYSLGITAYWMLTGKHPFTGENPLAVLLEHLHREAPPIRDHRPDIPEPLQRIVERMIAKKPDDRFNTPKKLLDELDRVRESILPPTKTMENGVEAPESSESSKASEKFDGHQSTAPIDAALFADDPDEQLFFSGQLSVLAASRQLATDFSAMKKEAGTPVFSRPFFRRFRGRIIAVFLTLFLLGGGLALGRFAFFSPFSGPSPAIRQFDSVEEQWVFAAQVGTPEAWRSVVEYHPNNPYWTRRANQQLARALMLHGQTREARKIFAQFAENKWGERQNISFGIAGMAWCLAAEGKTNDAAALLSELRNRPEAAYDRLTEEIISRTRELIRAGR